MSMAAPAPEPPLIVIDASVSLKWALDDEEGVAQAVALRDDALAGRFQLTAPSLWLYELTNGLVEATRRGQLGPDLSAQALQHILDLRLLRLADPEPTAVSANAVQHGLTAYDTAYLALAEALDTRLWTGNRRFYEAVGPKAPLVRWIGDYDSNGGDTRG